MKLTVKSRDAGFCNLKVFLLFLVIYGHLIEPCIGQSRAAYRVYHLIYMTHMPAFVFLSGLFLTDTAQGCKQGKNALLSYLAAQAAFLLVFDRGGTWQTPYWHLWYLLSLTMWSLLGLLYHGLAKRCRYLKSRAFRAVFLLLAVVVGCYVGRIDTVGRRYSLSRTLVFFPYFLLGMFYPTAYTVRNRHRKGIALFLAGALLYLAVMDKIPTTFLYHAVGYGAGRAVEGTLWRLICYAIGTLWTLSLLFLKWDRRLPVTKIGTDTLKLYIFHAPIVRGLWAYAAQPWYLPLAPVTAAVILCFLYRVFCFHGHLFRIQVSKRR